LSFSCYNKSYSKDNVIEANNNYINLKYCKSVIGTWQICKMISEEKEITYNVCPTIVFLSNGNGNIELPGKGICLFQWTVKNCIITFSFHSEEDKILFIAEDTEFGINIYDKNNLQIFELIQLGNNYKFILIRVK